jgi:hypothetical protein
MDPQVPTISDVQTPTPTEKPAEPVVPLSALDAERKQRQALAERLAAFETAQKQAAEQEAAKRGEFEKLWQTDKARADAAEAELTKLREHVDALNVARKAALVARLDKLPEAIRAIVPLDKLSVDVAEELIAKAEATAATLTPATQQQTKPAITPGRAAVEGGDPDALSPEEEAWARSKGYVGKASNATIKTTFAKLHPKK